MIRPFTSTGTFTGALALSAFGAGSPLFAAPSAELVAWSTRVGANAEMTVQAAGIPGDLYALYANDTLSARQKLITRGRFDANGDATVSVPLASSLPSNFAVNLLLVTRPNGVVQMSRRTLALEGAGGALCQEFDPNFALGETEPAVGETLTTQWAGASMSISAINNVPSHPQKAITFDSANPTGGDTDLATPGYGPGNTVAYGQLIIVPENDIDSNNDGLVDEPDDEQFGGTITFEFDEPFRMCSATLVDIDDSAPSELRFYIGNSLALETIPVAFQGDNGVQTITFDKTDVRRFEVVLGGSGAIARLGMVPCPIVLDFDETPFGKPLGLAAGTDVTTQFLPIGVAISALNNVPFHPDKAILFDSGNPTGDDFDLMTPGPGLNNTEALGQVLIIAENDVDANNDGLVDDPDDEAGGGIIEYSFTENVTFLSTLVLDVDAMERDIFRFFDENDVLVSVLEINALGDNSVQMLVPPAPIEGVRRITVNLTGSGAIARLRYCPESNR